MTEDQTVRMPALPWFEDRTPPQPVPEAAPPVAAPEGLPRMSVDLVGTPDDRIAITYWATGFEPVRAAHALRSLADDLVTKYVIASLHTGDEEAVESFPAGQPHPPGEPLP